MCVCVSPERRRRVYLSLSLSLRLRVDVYVCTRVAMHPATNGDYTILLSPSLPPSLSLTHSPVPTNITEFIQNDTRCATLSHDRLNTSAKRTLTPSSVIKVTLNYRESRLLLRASRPLSLNLQNLWKHASCASQKDTPAESNGSAIA